MPHRTPPQILCVQADGSTICGMHFKCCINSVTLIIWLIKLLVYSKTKELDYVAVSQKAKSLEAFPHQSLNYLSFYFENMYSIPITTPGHLFWKSGTARLCALVCSVVSESSKGKDDVWPQVIWLMTICPAVAPINHSYSLLLLW